MFSLPPYVRQRTNGGRRGENSDRDGVVEKSRRELNTVVLPLLRIELEIPFTRFQAHFPVQLTYLRHPSPPLLLTHLQKTQKLADCMVD